MSNRNLNITVGTITKIWERDDFRFVQTANGHTFSVKSTTKPMMSDEFNDPYNDILKGEVGQLAYIMHGNKNGFAFPLFVGYIKNATK